MWKLLKKKKKDSLYWEQITSMVAAGLVIYVLVQNSSFASTMTQQILQSLRQTLQNMLTGSY